MTTEKLHRVEKMTRYLRAYLGSDHPREVTEATAEAHKLACMLYELIDRGRLHLAIVDTPDKRFPAVTINAGDLSPDHVRMTIYVNMENQAALCEADRVLSTTFPHSVLGAMGERSVS